MPVMSTDTVADRVKQALKARRWTQKQLELHSGVSQQHVSQIVNGKRSPGFEYVIPIARALDVSLDWLAGLPPKEPGALEPDEEELLKAYQALDEAHRKVVLDMVRGLGER